MKKLIVTGSGGQLGRAVHRKLGDAWELVQTDVAEDRDRGIQPLDITDVERVMAFVRDVKPDGIVNCAAYTAVDAQERDVEASYRINAIGPRNLALAAREIGAKLIHISTDYVFSGDKDTPYTEFDEPAPISVYGRTKLAGERFVREFADRYFILRTAWLYGEGRNFVRTMLRLGQERDSVNVVEDQMGNPTSAEELVRAIAYLLPTDNYGLFHATCEGVCSWADLAEEVFRLAGKETRVERLTSAEYQKRNPDSAPRPHYSHLDKLMFRLTGDFRMCDWREALRVYLA